MHCGVGLWHSRQRPLSEFSSDFLKFYRETLLFVSVFCLVAKTECMRMHETAWLGFICRPCMNNWLKLFNTVSALGQTYLEHCKRITQAFRCLLDLEEDIWKTITLNKLRPLKVNILAITRNEISIRRAIICCILTRNDYCRDGMTHVTYWTFTHNPCIILNNYNIFWKPLSYVKTNGT